MATTMALFIVRTLSEQVSSAAGIHALQPPAYPLPVNLFHLLPASSTSPLMVRV